MDWFYIISGVIGNLVIGGVVIVAYKLTYHYAKKNIGWSGYKRVLLIIGIIILLIILNEYQYIGLLDTGLSKAQKEFIAKISLTILIASVTGAFIANMEIKESLYFNLQSDQILLYQHYFNKVLNAVDVNNYTMWAEGKNWDAVIKKHREDIFPEIISSKFSKSTAIDKLIIKEKRHIISPEIYNLRIPIYHAYLVVVFSVD